MKKILLILIFYILALIQTSFLIHFNIRGMVPNFLLISVIVINLIEKPEKKEGIWSSLIAGFFADVFSSGPIGIWTILFLVIATLIKSIFKRYVRIPFIEPR